MSDASLQAEATLSQVTVRKAWSRPPIEMDFQVLMLTASGECCVWDRAKYRLGHLLTIDHALSGLLVRYLKVWEKSGCKCLRGCCASLNIDWLIDLYPLHTQTNRSSGCDMYLEQVEPADPAIPFVSNVVVSNCVLLAMCLTKVRMDAIPMLDR